MILLGALIATVVVVVSVLTVKQKDATIQSFSEQQSSLIQFSIDNVELGLSTGRMDAVKKTLRQLQDYSIFLGSIVYDAELTPILAIPDTFKMPPDLGDVLEDRKMVTRGNISYERGLLRDEDGEPIGHLLIAFTFAPVEAAIRQGLLYASAAGLFTLLPMIGLSILRVRKMLKPLRKVVGVLEGVAEGDLTQYLDIKSGDETERISIALNKAVEEMRRSLKKIKASGEREKEHTEALEESVDHILKFVDGAAKGDLTQSIDVKGSDAIGLLGEGLERFFSDLKRRIVTIGGYSKELASSSAALTEVSRQMGANAKQSSERASGVAASAETMTGETNAIMLKLGQNNNEIKDVVSVISTLAEQTNLLALNATIEAARAGGAGKGFAVVANEVKGLSNETAKAAKEISEKITMIQADTEKAVQVIGEISSVKIADNIKHVAAAATDVADGANDTEATATKVSEMAALLRNFVQKYRV
ncbi:MAG: methyl-accepting chemotaxis protein [Nitrospiria bacterium]